MWAASRLATALVHPVGMRSLHHIEVQRPGPGRPRSLARSAVAAQRQGCVVFTSFPFGAQHLAVWCEWVFLVLECVWLGRSPWEETLPTHWNMLWKLFKTCFRQGKLSLAKERLTWILKMGEWAEWVLQSWTTGSSWKIWAEIENTGRNG